MITHTPSLPPLPGDDDEISLVQAANTVLRNWRLVLALPMLLAFAVGTWTLMQDRLYVASAAFLPQSPENRSASSAAALAQQFGVNLGGDRPGQTPQFYVDLLRSRTLLRQAVESTYYIPADNGVAWRGTLIDLWDLGASGQPAWQRAADRLSAATSTSVTRETGIVRLDVALNNPLLAERVAARLLDLLNDFNLGIRQSRAQDEGRFIAERLQEAVAELRDAEDALQEFLRGNREFRNSPALLFEHDRLQRNVLMRQEVHTSLVRTQLQARIDGVRDTPLFTVIDQPLGSAKPQGRGTLIRTLVAFLIGLVLSLVVSFVAQYARDRRDQNDPQYSEFTGLARQAWADLRRPGRWLRTRNTGNSGTIS